MPVVTGPWQHQYHGAAGGLLRQYNRPESDHLPCRELCNVPDKWQQQYLHVWLPPAFTYAGMLPHGQTSWFSMCMDYHSFKLVCHAYAAWQTLIGGALQLLFLYRNPGLHICPSYNAWDVRDFGMLSRTRMIGSGPQHCVSRTRVTCALLQGCSREALPTAAWEGWKATAAIIKC